MRHANQTATYFPLDKNGRADQQVVLRGVSWRNKTVAGATGKEALLSKIIICRVPVEIVPDDFLPKEGAMLVYGELGAQGLTDAALKHQYEAVTVKAVTDNREGLAPHWKLEGV